ncbi:MAG: penicillin-binding transpeptidase domain-containing protein, partial [Candidatus Eiseniibacteriota bacterium]
RLAVLYGDEGEPAQRTDAPTEDTALFAALMKAGLLTPRPDGGLDMVPPDYFLRRAAADAKRTGSRAQEEEQRRLHGILYNTPVGAIVRQQVALWNDTRHIAAIRDNRARLPGDTPASWDATADGGHPLRTGGLVPESFGYIQAGKISTGFGDWTEVSRDAGTVTFHTTLSVRQPFTLTLQIIGTPVKLPQGAKVEVPASDMPWPCPGKVEAAVVTLPIATMGEVPLDITVAPSAHCAPRVSGLAVSQVKDAAGAYTKYHWRPVGRSRPANQFVLTTSDRVLLTDAEGHGRPTDETYRLGLVPIIGFGPSDTFAMSGLMAQTRLPARGVTTALTLDSKIQAAAEEALLWGAGRFGANDPYAAERKGSVVVIDADSGAILAAAGYPTVPQGATPWDYASFATSFPLRDPASVFGWEVIDANNTPGSTFKPLVSIALMRSTGAQHERIATIMRGLTPEGLVRLAGLNPGQTSYTPPGQSRALDNFSNEATGHFNYPLRATACDAQSKPDPNFGLRQAVELSINVWFARMAVMLDEPTIGAFVDGLGKGKGKNGTVDAPETHLLNTMRWLGLDDRARIDLASNLPPSVELRRYNSAEGADVLYAQLARNALDGLELPQANPQSVKGLLLWIVALNGIGQSVSVSPLHMAKVAATVATGRRIHPYLIDKWDGAALTPPEAPALDVDPELLGLLRQGMKAVPEVGTAAGAFAQSPEFRCRVYGKTGTAEIDKSKSYNSAWFIGWLEPEPPATRRLAFACMMTHAFGPFRTGGGACAPVVNRMLRGITGADQARKPTQ